MPKIAHEHMTAEAQKQIDAEYDAWFAKLQALTTKTLNQDDWVVNWFDGWTPEESLKHGPAGEDD